MPTSNGMDSEDKHKLDRALELSEENNQMLKKMIRNMRWSRLIKVIYWTVIIAVSVGALYFAQPYVDSVSDAYNSIQDTTRSVNSIFGPK